METRITLTDFDGISKSEIFVTPGEQKCLHECCPSCGGSGNKKDGSGPCIHFIACSCPKCSPRC
jgi:hypothetical protein